MTDARITAEYRATNLFEAQSIIRLLEADGYKVEPDFGTFEPPVTYYKAWSDKRYTTGAGLSGISRRTLDYRYFELIVT